MCTSFKLIMSNLSALDLLIVRITSILDISRGMPHYRNQGRSTKVKITTIVFTNYRIGRLKTRVGLRTLTDITINFKII